MREAVRLTEHGRGGFGQDLIADEGRHFRGHVSVGNARFRGLQVFGLNGEIAYRVFKTILKRTKVRADSVFCDNGSINALKSLLRFFLGFYPYQVSLWQNRRIISSTNTAYKLFCHFSFNAQLIMIASIYFIYMAPNEKNNIFCYFINKYYFFWCC